MTSLHSDDTLKLRPIESRPSIEWPTVALAIAIYGGWFLLTWFWASIPYLLLFLAGGWIIAWHGSLQHEVLHGHPTRLRIVNDAIGWPPISLWLPYRLYKRSHLRHHHDEWLTDPIEDPESYYLTGRSWAEASGLSRAIIKVNNTLLGRLIIGPFIAVSALWVTEFTRLMKGDFRNAGIWLRHLAGVFAVLAWVTVICAMPVWYYLTAFAYAGVSFSRLRSFAEHHHAQTREERTAIVENTPALGLLFLHNNLHIVHHSLPQLPWYKIPVLYRAKRSDFVRMNGGLVYNGYLDVARKYFVRQHHFPVHPDHAEREISPEQAASAGLHARSG